MIFTQNVDTDELKGKIEVDLLPWNERISKSKELLYKLDGDKLVDREDLERYELAIKFAVERVKSVDLVTNDGQKVSSVDELMMYKEGTKLMNDISSTMINGVSLAKK